MQNSEKQRITALLGKKQYQDAKRLLAQFCENNEHDVEAWIGLVKICAQTGDFSEAERGCRQVLKLMPDAYEAHFQLGMALLAQRKNDDAIASFQQALTLRPDYEPAIFELGKIMQASMRLDEALEYFHRVQKINPNNHLAHSLIGIVLKHRGQINDAVTHYRKAVEISPDAVQSHSNLLFALNYSSEYDAETIYKEHVGWGQAHSLSEPLPCRRYKTGDKDRPLRIGYVSPDFCRHSVAFFFGPLLANHDAERFDIFCYSNVAEADSMTESLRSLSKNWYDVRSMNDHDLANQIRGNHIDILVDLTGHTANNRLLAFTRKPAPVQVTYLGYPNTTGMPSIDYRLTDAWADPPGMTDSYCTEVLVRLPHGFLCYQAPSESPAVGSLPCMEKKQITFGSFNNLAKISPETIALWASILTAVPASRLIVKNLSLHEEATRKQLHDKFLAYGVLTEQLELLAPEYKLSNHLSIYSQIDIALDTFPYNGTATTCEALWMGVPVITLAGKMHAGRVGISILSQLGLDETIAQTTDEYVAIAAKLAADTARLGELRGSLREKMSSSTLCDGAGFARDMECAYREMWEKWCARPQSD